ncbi:MAG: lipopolysaccharide heptosyltransferase II [Acidobacteria bacterium]|nr:lipopolysaccharide heptosyltransferase II [Acidobacteriota bacterium]
MIVADPAEISRILIRANNWIGDVVMISPAVRAIREHFRGARIGILAKGWVLETLRGNPYYDDLIEYDEGGAHRGLSGRLRLAAALRRGRFDLAVLFQKAFEAAALAFVAGARLRVGYATDFRSPLLTHALEPPPPGTHHVQVFLGIARALGCPVADSFPSFHVGPAARERAAALLAEAGFLDGAPLVAIHPGASKPPRAWHAERFGDLARRLAEGARARVILLGDAADRPLLERVAARAPAGQILMTRGDLPIAVAGGLLQRCSLFVGNDSGPMHLAAALGVPTVGVFGPGTPKRTAPLASGAAVAVVTKGYPCSPCRQDFFRECPPSPAGKPFCLEEIRVDDVEEAALALLRAPGRGQA